MAEKSKYAEHLLKQHKVQQTRPNAHDIIEECTECPQRFLIDPRRREPLELSPKETPKKP